MHSSSGFKKSHFSFAELCIRIEENDENPNIVGTLKYLINVLNKLFWELIEFYIYE